MFDSVTLWRWPLAVGVLFLAFLVRGAFGFGSGLIAVPLLVQAFPITVVVPAVALLEYLASAVHGVSHRRAVQYGELVALLPFSAVGLVVALVLFEALDPGTLTRWLGFLVLAYGFWTLVPLRARRRHRRGWAAPLGLLAGLVGTLFGTGGPFYVIYFTLRGLGKAQFRATFATLFLVEGLARLVGYGAAGMLGGGSLLLAAAGLPMLLGGLYVGGKLHLRLGPRAFQRWIGLLLALAGVSLLLQ